VPGVAEARKLVYHGLTAIQIIGDSLDSGPVSVLIEKKRDLTFDEKGERLVIIENTRSV